MDTPVAALGAIQITITSMQMIAQLNSVYSGVSDSPYQPPKKILSELPILISLLQEIQSKASNSFTEPPPTVSIALQISVERFEELMGYLAYMGLDPITGQALPGKRHKMQRVVQMIHWTNTGQLQDVTKRFRSALTLLRDIAMDQRTHDLITQQRAFLRYEFDYTRSLLSRRKGLSSSDDFVEDTFMDLPDDSPAGAEGQTSLRFSPGSGTLFSITFSLDVPDGDRPLFYPARAKYDTGCPDCLISAAVIRKFNLESCLENVETERQYTGLGNVEVISKSQVNLNWSANNETVSRRNTFYVVADSPFELLLGEDFMMANSPLLPALPIRLLNGKSKAQKKMEAEKEAVDNQKGAELANQRRRGKATQKQASAGASASAGKTADRTRSTPNTRQLQTPPPSPVEKAKTDQHISEHLTRKPEEKPQAPLSPAVRDEEEKLEKKETQPDQNLRIVTSTETEAPLLAMAEGQPPSTNNHAPQDASPVPEESMAQRPPLATTGTASDEKPSSSDSGYMSEVLEEVVTPSKDSAAAEKVSSLAQKPNGSQPVSSTPPEKIVKNVSNISPAREDQVGVGVEPRLSRVWTVLYGIARNLAIRKAGWDKEE
ncbi:hypothetical protein BKA61DRAFT_709693 [Leptodontidium sp. MPI-SDFR-AT-0119]|nr:hypothetical protein BKA61DRAFT_709693 [Leptodontidium sp. MPI-SDFR-AT-0119]